METLHPELNRVSSPRIGEGEIESSGTNADRLQVRIADKLHQAAETLFGNTEGNQIPHEGSNLSSQASTWLHKSADYIEQIEPEKIKADITGQVQRNPGKSLLVAGAAGLILGAIFRRR
ncbi:MAG: hypothetical protein ABIU20_08925 [Blastocatellia bacterium]